MSERQNRESAEPTVLQSANVCGLPDSREEVLAALGQIADELHGDDPRLREVWSNFLWA